MNEFLNNLVENHLDIHGSPKDKESEGLLHLFLNSEDHIANGYKGNFGRDRCIRKNGSFDYLKMSKLVHEKKW